MTERKLFGTDGVRDIANRGRMTPEAAMQLGRAYVKAQGVRRVVVGTDTRISCRMLEGALISGITSEGADVYLAGIIPTPGVSYGVRKLGADGGAVISASHNPAEYNGIKFLGSDGCKLSDEAELAVERELCTAGNTSSNVGAVYDEPELVKSYAEHIGGMLDSGAASDGLAFDCACGAASESVPYMIASSQLRSLDVRVIGTDYDGLNINRTCGVMHMDSICSFVKASGLSLGFAFDGDADRVLISDKFGRVIDGDIILWVLARWLKLRGYQGSDKVVATVMSNMALETHLAEEGIQTLRCPVGDRYVLELMHKSNAILGGE